jgi:hypothetical protein
MQFEKLPPALQEVVVKVCLTAKSSLNSLKDWGVVGTKHNSATLHSYVKDALDQAEDLEEFEDYITNSLSIIIDEATQLRNAFDQAFAKCAKNSSGVQEDDKGSDTTPETT